MSKLIIRPRTDFKDEVFYRCHLYDVIEKAEQIEGGWPAEASSVTKGYEVKAQSLVNRVNARETTPSRPWWRFW